MREKSFKTLSLSKRWPALPVESSLTRLQVWQRLQARLVDFLFWWGGPWWTLTATREAVPQKSSVRSCQCVFQVLHGVAWWHIIFVNILDLDDQLISIRWPLEHLFIFCPAGLCSLLSPLMSQELLLDWCQTRLLVRLIYYYTLSNYVK